MAQAGATGYFALNENAFKKCAPAISTNIKQCGSVTVCNAKSITSEELTEAYMRSNEFRVMEALFHHDMEIKMCEAVQEGLYEFFMANKVNLSNRITSRRVNSGLIEIAPFILARQYSPINNEYWEVYSGLLNGVNWQVRVRSTTNIPADVRSFPAGLRVYIQGKSAGGSATKTAWRVVSATLAGDSSYVTLVLADQNAASNLDPDKLGYPIQGILSRGTPNINDYEQWCNEAPAYLNWKNVPFWVETTRTSMCRGELYDKWRKLVMEGNALYREFFDLDEIEKNRQLAKDWQRRLVNAMFWNKPLPFQNLAEYDNLDDINTYNGSTLGVDGAKCIGKRANSVGIYEQLAECDRISDLQGQQLNLPALFTELYNMMRVREGRNHPNPKVFDLFTDSVFAELINQAMLAYYQDKSQNMLRLNYDVQSFNVAKKAEFGFYYRSYPLFWPQGIVINVITHNFFDDWITAATVASQADTARVLWVLDFAGIYPGILASNRVVGKTGDLKTLAAINTSFACVMAVPTQEQTLTSMTWTMIVECPAGNLILENIAATVPSITADPNVAYPNASTTTTTTTPTTYWNTEQSYTTDADDCPGGSGTPVENITVTVPANTYASTVSQGDANAQALAAATAQAKAQLQCV
jgi:hypothetical protein